MHQTTGQEGVSDSVTTFALEHSFDMHTFHHRSDFKISSEGEAYSVAMFGDNLISQEYIDKMKVN
jgi:hypothetical protein